MDEEETQRTPSKTVSSAQSGLNDGVCALLAAGVDLSGVDGSDDFEMGSQTLRGFSLWPMGLDQHYKTAFDRSQSIKSPRIGEIIEDDDEDVDSNFAVVIDSDLCRPYRYPSVESVHAKSTYFYHTESQADSNTPSTPTFKTRHLTNRPSKLTTASTHSAFPCRQVRKIRVHQPLPLRVPFHHYIPPTPLSGLVDNTDCQLSWPKRPRGASPVSTPILAGQLDVDSQDADCSVANAGLDGRDSQRDAPNYNPSFGDAVFRLKKVSQWDVSPYPSFTNDLSVPAFSTPESFFLPTQVKNEKVQSHHTETQSSRCTLIPERVPSPLSTAPPFISRFTKLEAPNPNFRTTISPSRAGRISRMQRDKAIRNRRNALAEKILAERKMRENAQRYENAQGYEKPQTPQKAARKGTPAYGDIGERWTLEPLTVPFQSEAWVPGSLPASLLGSHADMLARDVIMSHTRSSSNEGAAAAANADCATTTTTTTTTTATTTTTSTVPERRTRGRARGKPVPRHRGELLQALRDVCWPQNVSREPLRAQSL